MAEHITVAFCFDEYYAQFASVAVRSLIGTSKTPLRIYCVMPSAAEGRTPLISTLAETYDFIRLIYCDASRLSGLSVGGHLKLATYLRLLIPELIEEEKVLYLDSDLLVRRDLADLYAVDLDEDHLIAAALDMNGNNWPMGRLISDVYVNAGVLLLNNRALRAEKFFEACLTIHQNEFEYVRWADQCLINRFAEGRKRLLGSDWNHMLLADAITEPLWRAVWTSPTVAIAHFIGENKPWNRSSQPFVTRDWLLCANVVDPAPLKRIAAGG